MKLFLLLVFKYVFSNIESASVIDSKGVKISLNEIEDVASFCSAFQNSKEELENSQEELENSQEELENSQEELENFQDELENSQELEEKLLKFRHFTGANLDLRISRRFVIDKNGVFFAKLQLKLSLYLKEMEKTCYIEEESENEEYNIQNDKYIGIQCNLLEKAPQRLYNNRKYRNIPIKPTLSAIKEHNEQMEKPIVKYPYYEFLTLKNPNIELLVLLLCNYEYKKGKKFILPNDNYFKCPAINTIFKYFVCYNFFVIGNTYNRLELAINSFKTFEQDAIIFLNQLCKANITLYRAILLKNQIEYYLSTSLRRSLIMWYPELLKFILNLNFSRLDVNIKKHRTILILLKFLICRSIFNLKDSILSGIKIAFKGKTRPRLFETEYYIAERCFAHLICRRLLLYVEHNFCSIGFYNILYFQIRNFFILSKLGYSIRAFAYLDYLKIVSLSTYSFNISSIVFLYLKEITELQSMKSFTKEMFRIRVIEFSKLLNENLIQLFDQNNKALNDVIKLLYDHSGEYFRVRDVQFINLFKDESKTTIIRRCNSRFELCLGYFLAANR